MASALNHLGEIMRLRIRSLWIRTGLNLGLLLFGTVSVATAGAAGGGGQGLTVGTGTITPVGDPEYTYSFDILLGAGDTLTQNKSYITIYDLGGIAPHTGTTEPNQYWGESENLTGITPSDSSVHDSATIENITWFWNGATFTNTGSTAEDLGIFTIGPTVGNYVPPTGGETLVYVGSLDGTTQADTGSILVNVVPEPSSIALLLCAMSIMLPLLVSRRRQLGMIHSRATQLAGQA